LLFCAFAPRRERRRKSLRKTVADQQEQLSVIKDGPLDDTSNVIEEVDGIRTVDQPQHLQDIITGRVTDLPLAAFKISRTLCRWANRDLEFLQDSAKPFLGLQIAPAHESRQLGQVTLRLPDRPRKFPSGTVKLAQLAGADPVRFPQPSISDILCAPINADASQKGAAR
jgi:hypothetical protein